MKICLLARYFDYRGTGITRMSTEILKGLVKRRHSVHAISTRGSSLYSYFFYTFFQIPLKLPRRDFDIYHAVTSPMEGMWLSQDRSVVTYCDAIPILHPERFGSGMGYSGWKNYVGKMLSGIGWRLSSRARILTCTSEQTKLELVKYFDIPGSKIRVLRMGIRGDLNYGPKRDSVFRIGTLGQLDRRKRVNLLIKAFLESGIDGELAIAGTGMDESLLKRLAGNDSRIKFLGLVPDSQLVDFYNSLDVFIFPTWVEGYGLPMVEAMACKKPVVVLDDAIIPREIKKRCVMVEDLDIALGNKEYLMSLCEGVDYEDNYKFAKEHSWDEYVDALVKIYEEVLSAKS